MNCLTSSEERGEGERGKEEAVGKFLDVVTKWATHGDGEGERETDVQEEAPFISKEGTSVFFLKKRLLCSISNEKERTKEGRRRMNSPFGSSSKKLPLFILLIPLGIFMPNYNFPIHFNRNAL